VTRLVEALVSEEPAQLALNVIRVEDVPLGQQLVVAVAQLLR
jgi:hypothetical protein